MTLGFYKTPGRSTSLKIFQFSRQMPNMNLFLGNGISVFNVICMNDPSPK